MSRIHRIIIVTFLLLPIWAQSQASELRDYGEYLSGECTTCHRDGSEGTIPSIVGFDQESFIAIMYSYKTGERESKAMISVAQALDEEQIKALAEYFSSLKPKGN